MKKNRKFSSLVDMLSIQKQSLGNKIFSEFLVGKGKIEERMSYQGLYNDSLKIAIDLHTRGMKGNTIILLYPPGHEYIRAFFGCMLAGAIPVPAYPPMGAKDIDRLTGIISDCNAKLILSTSESIPMIRRWIISNTNNTNIDNIEIDCVASDTMNPHPDPDFSPSTPEGNDIAFLQYTSGSTGHPKGAIVSHGNLLANFESIQDCFLDDDMCSVDGEKPKAVIWLPPFHDMGLIGGILLPLSIGASVTLMSPLTFMKDPYVWLKAISDRKANISGGPNFSYKYCMSKITPEQKSTLDLRHWKIAFNGAEPIQAESLREFSEYFSDAGFNRNAFLPCYGLAEATLFVSGTPTGRGALSELICPNALSKNRTETATPNNANIELVSSGLPSQGTTIAIVNPATNKRVNPGHIGEIWVDSPSVCQGYWNKPQYSNKVFRALIKTSDGNYSADMKTYLRTGDLGFLKNNELFVTGRLKEVLIIAGRNHYPQDIERSFQKSSNDFRNDSGAAFTVTSSNGEQLVIVQELAKRADTSASNLAKLSLLGAGAISSAHGISAKSIILIKSSSLPKTSSGKTQRVEAKKQYDSQKLNVLYSWNTNKSHENSSSKIKIQNTINFEGDNHPILQDMLLSWLSKRLNVDSQHLDLDLTFAELGVDSIEAIELIDFLQAFIGRTIAVTELFKYPTVNALITHFSHIQKLDGINETNRGEVEA
ncbi:hypothetical protein A9Q99_21400 [Gammaproteobacteria bacterium 45_16_T64]|nr:hypothetical protein A9Q99_21400 [Gammaproteobacteria bacterium 45_16_T64]